MITTNEQFKDFLQSRGKRQDSIMTKDYRYYLFKIAYDDDCDFIHTMRVYKYSNPDGKPNLKDKSELGGIFIYSLGLLFNTEYDMRSLLKYLEQESESLSVSEYYKQFCKDVEKEIVRRIEAGLFDRADAKKQIKDDDSDIQYITKYREQDSVKRIFLEGLQLTKPDICVSYSTRYDYDIDIVLRYLRYPSEIIAECTDIFMQENKAMIYRQIVRAEIQFEDWQKLEADTSNPLHYMREIQRIMRTACVKTVNVTLERDGKSITVKVDATRLGWNTTFSNWYILSVDRLAYDDMFNHRVSGDAKLTEITRITHGKKELYNKAEFEKTLKSEDK